MKAIIPTGGRGTRMRPLTFSTNKHFIPVANKPLIFYPIESVVEAGITDIGITYNPEFLDVVKSELGDGSRWGARFTYILQEKPAGLANIIEVAEEFIGNDKFFLHLGDNIFADGIKEFVDYFNQNDADALVPMVHHKENRRLGVPYFDEQGHLVKYVEKPENPPHDYAIPGLYFFKPKVYECFRGDDRIQPSARGELEISAPFQWLIDHKFQVDVKEYGGRWLDPGKFDDWIEANQYLLDQKLVAKVESEVDSTSTIENRVSIGKNCQIFNSHIRGPVAVADNVIIKDSFIGPFSSIGKGCEIDKSHVENCVLMDKVKVISVDSPIDMSLIGAESEIRKNDGPTSSVQLFIGEKCSIKL